MHDPLTVAFEIRSPIKHITPMGYEYHNPIVTIWHRDPESDGTDDSCGWTWPKLSDKEHALVDSCIDNENDNLRHWFTDCDAYDAKMRIAQIFRVLKHHQRPWWKHPRWHFRHWRFQVHPIQDLQRWLFSRCAKCGKRFAWGYAPIASGWNLPGPRWFRGERGVYHHECQSVGHVAVRQ